MIKQLLRAAGRQPAVPVAVLALGGVAGALALSRPGAVGRAGRDVLAALPEGVRDNLRDSARHAVRDGMTALGAQASRPGERVGEALATLGERSEQAAESAREHLPSLSSPLERLRDRAGSMGPSEKTVAVFAATFLAKSFSGYLRWRGEEKARSQAEALASTEGRDFDAQLHDRTVVELRQMAAEQEIEGRSSMNKEALIEALESDR